MACNQGDVVLVFCDPDVDANPCSEVSCAPSRLIVVGAQDLGRARHHAQGVLHERTTKATDDDVTVLRCHGRTHSWRPVHLPIPQSHDVLRPFHDDEAQVGGMTVVTPSPVVAFQVNLVLMVP